jgi:hypothetical protein
MPNWCNNQITCEGSKENIKNLKKLLRKTVEVQNKTGEGQLLFGLEGAIDGYMFDIEIHTSYKEALVFSFNSRWAPIVNDIVRIAEIFNLTFEYVYEEGGMNLYGKYIYEEGNLEDYALTEDQIEACRLPEDPDDEGCGGYIDYEQIELTLDELVDGVSVDITRLQTKEDE